MNFVYHVEGGDFTNAGSTSSQVKRMLKKIGVSPEIVKKTVVALYEAEVNIVAHAYRGDITVDLEEDHIKIVLADEGPGIPADEVDKVTKKYYRASNSVYGTGIGLALVNEIVKAHDGQLMINSVFGSGTEVAVMLPLDETN